MVVGVGVDVGVVGIGGVGHSATQGGQRGGTA